MTDVARLLFPAVRWDPGKGDWDMAHRFEGLIRLGVGGWILFGGPAAAVAELTQWLRAEAPHPILIGADLERGAGQQFDGATRLPPAGALASIGDLDLTRRAGELTGREAVALGVDWVYAPVADVDVEPENPIVGTRAFGSDPETAAGQVAAWIDGCRAGGAMTCAKHFPGHGRTTADSHLALPAVDAGRESLDLELAPFRAAVEAGVESVMTAHVAYPALDPSGAPATLSRPILKGWLRDRLGFGGLVVTDAMIMGGVTGVESSGDAMTAAVHAVAAGCDALLYPEAPEATAATLDAARGESLAPARVEDAIARIDALARSRERPAEDGATRGVDASAVGRDRDRSWALELAARTVHPVRGDTGLPRTFELVTVDDDVGGPYPEPDRSVFPDTLRKAGFGVIPVGEATGARPAVVAVYADVRGFKGRAGLSDRATGAVRRAGEVAPSSLVVLFGHPRLAGGLPGENVVCAWGGEPNMQEAAAVRLAGPPRKDGWRKDRR